MSGDIEISCTVSVPNALLKGLLGQTLSLAALNQACFNFFRANFVVPVSAQVPVPQSFKIR